MTSPKIDAISIVQCPHTQRWKAHGHVDGIGWLEAWGKSLIEAMEAMEKKAAERVAERGLNS